MRGFGRYSALNQAHRSAKAREAATKDWKSVARNLSERYLKRREQEQPVRTVERASASPLVVETFSLRPSRPLQTEAQSKLLPNGPAPGESDAHYAWRRHVMSRQIIEREKAVARDVDAIPRVLRTETNPVRRNKEIQAILDRRAAEAEARQAKAAKGKDAGKGVEINDD